MNTFAAWLILLAYLAFALAPWRRFLSRGSQRLGDWTVALFLIPLLLATSFQPTWETLIRFGIYLAIPTLLLRLRPKNARPLDIFHILTILSLWLPIEPDLFIMIFNLITPGFDLAVQVPAVWLALPGVEATLVSGVDLPIDMLTAVLLVLYLFLLRHPLEGTGFNFRLNLDDLKKVNTGLLIYTVIGIPLGLLMGFLRYKLDWPGPVDAILALIAGYLLTALAEEILFRGVIQNLLLARLGREKLALPIAALIFGMAHLNNSTPRFPEPNWGYFLMASIAGLAYGWVWMRTKKVTASAITHALVNFVWGILLGG